MRIEFKTARLTIGPWQGAAEVDLRAIFVPEVVHALPPSFMNVSDPQSFLSDLGRDTTVCGIWCDQRLAGILILYVEGKAAHLGYVLAQAYWGQGFGREVVQGLCHHLPKTEISTLYAGVAPDNLGSIRILESVGFRKTPSDQDGVLKYVFDLR